VVAPLQEARAAHARRHVKDEERGRQRHGRAQIAREEEPVGTLPLVGVRPVNDHRVPGGELGAREGLYVPAQAQLVLVAPRPRLCKPRARTPGQASMAACATV